MINRLDWDAQQRSGLQGAIVILTNFTPLQTQITFGWEGRGKKRRTGAASAKEMKSESKNRRGVANQAKRFAARTSHKKRLFVFQSVGAKRNPRDEISFRFLSEEPWRARHAVHIASIFIFLFRMCHMFLQSSVDTLGRALFISGCCCYLLPWAAASAFFSLFSAWHFFTHWFLRQILPPPRISSTTFFPVTISSRAANDDLPISEMVFLRSREGNLCKRGFLTSLGSS